MELKTILIFLLLNQQADCSRHQNIIKTTLMGESTTLLQATIRIIEDFYATISSTLFIVRRAVAFPANETHRQIDDLINEILKKSNMVAAVTIEDVIGAGDQYLRDSNLLIVDSYEAFQYVLI